MVSERKKQATNGPPGPLYPGEAAVVREAGRGPGRDRIRPLPAEGARGLFSSRQPPRQGRQRRQLLSRSARPASHSQSESGEMPALRSLLSFCPALPLGPGHPPVRRRSLSRPARAHSGACAASTVPRPGPQLSAKAESPLSWTPAVCTCLKESFALCCCSVAL